MRKKTFISLGIKMYIQSLAKDTKALFEKTQNIKKISDYHLVWWTALAIYIGHRESVDLDFVKYDILSKIDKDIFKSIWPDYEVIYESDEQLDLFVEKAKLTVFSYRWQPLFPLQKVWNINIWDIRDIAISKASTIWRRSEIKDYIDLYCLLSENHIDIIDLINLSKKKLWWDFNPKLFLKQLLLVDNCEDLDIPILWWRNINKNTMKKFFINIVRDLI